MKAFYNYLQRLREGVASEWWKGSLKAARGGKVLYVEAAVAPIRDDKDAPVRYLWLLRDVTATKQAEQTLREEKEFARTLIETAQAIILVLDRHGRIVRSNHYLHTLSGYTAQELYGQNWASLSLREQDQEAAREMLFDVLTFGKSRDATYGLVTKNRDQRTVSWSAKPLAPAGTESEQAALLLVGHDITELQEAQKQALQMERLAAIGQAMTGLTHESRNALQRAMACLEILKLRLRERPEDLELLARMQRAQDDLLRLYEEVRGYGAPLHLNRERCQMASIWREAWGQVILQFPGKEAALCETIAGVDLCCQADVVRLVQVFRNLLENSFAACAGPVRVEIIEPQEAKAIGSGNGNAEAAYKLRRRCWSSPATSRMASTRQFRCRTFAGCRSWS
jgi:PAS domain S-box-containing protein